MRLFCAIAIAVVIGGHTHKLQGIEAFPQTRPFSPRAGRTLSIHSNRRWVSTSPNSPDQVVNGDSGTDGDIDRAPCFDGICSSDPSPKTDDATVSSPHPGGEATQRLGTMTGPTVWSEFGRIAAQNPDIANLGQGKTCATCKIFFSSLHVVEIDDGLDPISYNRLS